MLVPIIGAVTEICSSALMAGIVKSVLPKTASTVTKVIFTIGAISISSATGFAVKNAFIKEFEFLEKKPEKKEEENPEEKTVATADDNGNVVKA